MSIVSDKTATSAENFLPGRKTLRTLQNAARSCRGCEPYREATQVVFGAGAPSAALVLVGEQPGDAEDQSGEPFVGPAGKLLDKALEAAGIARGETYVTNPVKHFKWDLRGKRRLHKTPTQREIDACNSWLREELALIAPRAIACLGATAARAVFGKPLKIGACRGRLLSSAYSAGTLVTVHPSSLLRLREPAERAAAFNQLVADLRLVGALL